MTTNTINQHNPAFSSAVFAPQNLPSIFVDGSINESNKSRFWHRFFRNKFIAHITQIERGHIIIQDPWGQIKLGNENTDLHCQINIKEPATYMKMALAGSNGAAQAYIDSLWSCDNPTTLIRILLRNRKLLDELEVGSAKIAQSIYQIWHWFNRNSKSGSKKNIAAHYDLGNPFFNLFLDEKMMYSSSLYQQGDNLEDASERKLQRICDVLQLSAQDSVVEIGTGWGGFACYAAAKTGCKITTITISEEQFTEAKSRIEQQNLSHLVTVKLQDYRDIEGQFDKLVSIEMIEAVGHQYLPTYFKKIHQLLKPNGKALLQAIVIDDDRYQQALKEVDFIKRYIFPGSFIPSYSIINSTAKENGLVLENQFDMGSSYAQTLRDWRRRFYSNIEKVNQLGYDTKFKRMWEFYLCYCEGGFEERAISVGQLCFTKRHN